MKLLSASIVFAAFAAASSVSSPVHATAICDQQYQKCINDGIYPLYKCEQLRLLCEDVYGAVPAKQDPLDRKELAKASTRRPVAPGLVTTPAPAAP